MKFSELEAHFEAHREEIEHRMEQFRSLRDASDERWFQELSFVLLSSQSSAREAWKAAAKISELDSVKGPEDVLNVVKRFDLQYGEKKSEQLVDVRRELSQPTLNNPDGGLDISARLELNQPEKARKWMADSLPGIGLKGASHFLRNVGHGEDLGIASRHTLSSLRSLGVIDLDRPPGNLEEYLEMEEEMRKIGERLGTCTGAVDLALWSKETGEVFR
ncbi:MAG: hypothetical protein ABEJ03_04165 [Candidatus Nanohaloarchaea archaeon]